MSLRSFTVFQDIPSDHNDADASTIVLSPTTAAATLLSTLAAIEKENLHPITGQRTGSAVGSDAKKRKSAALATKALVDSSSKKHKELKEQPKKTRKPLTSSAKPRSSDARKSSSKSSRSSRKASPLPPVVEEQASQPQPPRLSTSQLDVDSRCYELTVSPLADVSEAYDTTRAGSQESDVHTEREQSVEPTIRDHFSPRMVNKPLQSNNTTDDSSRQTSNHSTPERQRTYSAFTFSSPSPTSERFKQANSSPTRHGSPVSTSE